MEKKYTVKILLEVTGDVSDPELFDASVVQALEEAVYDAQCGIKGLEYVVTPTDEDDEEDLDFF